MSTVLLASGGVDSCVLAAVYAETGVDVLPLFIDYGQLAAGREWAACQVIMATIGVRPPVRMDLSGFGSLISSGLTSEQRDVNRDAFLPSRNLLLVVAACGYAFSQGASEVAIGLVDEQSRLFPDQSSTFLEKAQIAVNEALGLELRLVAPLLGLKKQDVLSLGRSLRLTGTYSCHRGTVLPCGECVSCLEAIRASRS